jgi:16S rRNA (uracil1498-N3)-methyltransferase
MTPRIFVAEPFVANALVALPSPALRHVHALRLQPGDAVTLFNGSDGADWPGELVEVGRGRAVVRIGAPVAVDRELSFAVTLAIGVPANDRMDALVEKAGELGAAAIQPLAWRCARCCASPASAPKRGGATGTRSRRRRASSAGPRARRGGAADRAVCAVAAFARSERGWRRGSCSASILRRSTPRPPGQHATRATADRASASSS